MIKSQALRPGVSMSYTSTGSDPDLGLDQSLDQELKRLAEINKELLNNVRSDQATVHAPTSESDELTALRTENADLRARIDELEAFLESRVSGAEMWPERMKEYESLLEEKTEVIRGLHARLQELEQAEAAPTAGAENTAGPSLTGNHDQLLALKKELEAQRKQLEEDEVSLMTQMREMEMVLSRDRAEVARQRSELQRLEADLHREIDRSASNDPTLRERLLNLQRPQQPFANREPQQAAAAKTPTATPRGSSGLLRRIFG